MFASGCRRVVDYPRGMTVVQSKQPKRPGSFAQRKVQDTLNHPAVHVPCFCLFPRSNARSLEVQVVACNWGAQRSVHFARQMERGLAGHAACVGGSWKPVNPSCASLARVAGLNVPP